VGVEDAGPSTSTSHAELIDQESTSADSSFGEGENEWTGSMDVQSDDIGDQSDDMLLAEGDYFGNGSQPRVKVRARAGVC
jgi:hypothetical protein